MGDPCSIAIIEILLSKSIDTICQCFGDPSQTAIAQRSSSFLHLEENWCSLQEERDNLEAKDAEIKAQVVSEENKLKICSDDVRLWQKKVAQALQNTAAHEEKYEALARCPCNCTPNLLQRYQLGKKVMENLQNVKKLIAEGRAFTTVAHEQQPEIVEQRISAKHPFGMDTVMKKLQAYFSNKDKSIVGIHGLGGVGKTTLLNEFNNNLKTSDFFQVVIFIELSYPENLNVEDMQWTIADRVGLPWKDSQSIEERARVLLKALKRKKFVILLDDVRREFKLEKVGIPTPNVENKCKLILTSRSHDVCIQMGAQSSLIKVKCLEKKPAWDLFRSNLSKNATTAMDRDDAIKRHGEAIVHKCGGLPLALNVIGKAVASLTSLDDWKSAAETLTASPSDLSGMEEYLFNPLKYSYDQLKSVHKQCFLYCALFPEYGSIKKDQLIEYWMGEGLTTGPAQGRQIINILVSASLLERGDKESRVKMHDIIRKLALWLASDCGTREDSSFLVQAGLGLNRAPTVKKKWKAATRISLMSNSIGNLPDSPNCSNLSTLLLQNNPNLHNLPQNLFKCMPLLRVLDLSHTAIQAFPIGTNVLGKLEHLNLCNTSIKKLPTKLFLLKKLKYLNLSATSALKVIPNGTISKLFKLRVLNLYKSFYGIWEVEDLNLEHLENLESLGITIYSEDVLHKLHSTDPLAESTRWLSLKHCKGMKSIQLSVFQHMVRMAVLFVHSCNELNEVILDEIRTESTLQELTLADLPNLVRVSVGPESIHLQNLCDLTIESCHELETVTCVLQLQSLEKLVISHCYGMEQVVDEGIINVTQITNSNDISQGNGIEGKNEEATGEDDEIQVVKEQNGTEKIIVKGTDAPIRSTNAFRKLKTIILKDLTKLESICRTRYFPCLEIINVENCPNLRRLPLGCDYEKLKLKQIRGSLDWWNKLVWEEENLETIFSHHFDPI